MPQLYTLTILFFRWPSKEQVHEERVELSDLCLRLKSAASSFSPLNIIRNVIRPILSTMLLYLEKQLLEKKSKNWPLVERNSLRQTLERLGSSSSGHNFIKHFFSLSLTLRTNKLVFIPGKLFQPKLALVITLSLRRFAKAKRSSLFLMSVGDRDKGG